MGGAFGNAERMTHAKVRNKLLGNESDKKTNELSKKDFRAIDGFDEAMGYARKEYATLKPKISEAEETAIKRYTNLDYLDINNYLRFNKNSTNSQNANVEPLKSAINKTEIRENLKVYRGMRSNALDTLLASSNIDKPKDLIGEVIQDNGFISTSMSRKVAKGFAGKNGVLVEVLLPKGSKGLMPNGESRYSAEQEVILQAGGKMKIMGVRSLKQLTVLEVILVSDKD